MNEGVPRSDRAPPRPPACTSGILTFSSAEPLPVASAAPPAASPKSRANLSVTIGPVDRERGLAARGGADARHHLLHLLSRGRVLPHGSHDATALIWTPSPDFRLPTPGFRQRHRRARRAT